MSENLERKPEPQNPGEKWAIELFKDKRPDVVAEFDVDELTRFLTTEDPEGFLDSLDRQADNDPNVLVKNRLLAKLVELASKREYASDFLGLLEHQAETLDEQSDETRYRQFMGLLDVVTACFTDEELRDVFERQKHSLEKELGPIED